MSDEIEYSLSTNCDGVTSGVIEALWGSPLLFVGKESSLSVMPAFSLSCLFDVCSFGAMLFNLFNSCWFVVESLLVVWDEWKLLAFVKGLCVKVLSDCLSLMLVGIKLIAVDLLSPSNVPASLGPPLIPGGPKCPLSNVLPTLPTLHVGWARRGCTARNEGTLKFPVWGFSLDSVGPYFLGSCADELTCVLVELTFGDPLEVEDATDKRN